MLKRVVQAVLFDPAAFEGLRDQRSALAAVGIIVFLAGVSSGFGAAFMPLEGKERPPILNVYFLTVLAAFLTWLAWSLLNYLIGTLLLRGQAGYKDLLRGLGLAYIPAFLMFLIFLPAVQGIVGGLLIWMAGIGVTATKGVQGFGILKSLLTTVLCWLILLIVINNVLVILRIVE